jgi:hypothetical protein
MVSVKPTDTETTSGTEGSQVGTAIEDVST